MDAITFRYLISLAVSEKLDMRLMDVVTAYLSGDLNIDFYIKIPERLALFEEKLRSMYLIKLRRVLYGLKQTETMWCNHLN